MTSTRAAVAVLLLLLATPAAAQLPPGEVSFQGFLEDPVAGGPASGDFDMTFELWDDPVAGTLIGSAGPLVVTVTAGVFQVALPFGAADFDGSPRHLQIVVDGESLSPRLPVLSVPYAQIAGQATTAVTVVGGAVTEAGIADGAVTPTKLAPACAEGEVLQQSAGAWVCVPLPAGGPVCSPGDFLNCFDGPPSAIGVGPCRAGMRFCSAAGDGFGVCTGDVLPATEVCDGVDNDCDGQGEDGAIDAVPRYLDGDGDGFGDTSTEELSCDVSPPFVGTGGDCDDASPTTFPGANELCDGIDNDCNAQVDDACADCSDAERVCVQACNQSCDGDSACGGSCTASCGLSAACVPLVVELALCGQQNGCPDQGAAFLEMCLRGSCAPEYVAVFGTECTPAEVRPCGSDVGVCQIGSQTCADTELWGACAGSVDPTPEVCGDGLDNDCDGQVDEEGDVYYPDQDTDGFGLGDPGQAVSACVAPPGFVLDGTDCDDTDASVFPGAPEICEDGIDNDCDGEDLGEREWYRDADGDGFGDDADVLIDCFQPPGYVDQPGDCDDTDAGANPAAVESCDLLDNDCNGTVDDGFPTQEAFGDGDDDGFGDGAAPAGSFCVAPPGTVFDDQDCDDTDASVNPGAAEICDGIDNDCSGDVDEGLLQDAYTDADGDLFGDPFGFLGAFCSEPAGSVFNDQDCDDADAAINPAAVEICGNAVDEDCDGSADACP